MPRRWLSGGLFALVGLFWLGQGIGLIPGSFMTGSLLWAAIGTLLIMIGVALWRGWTGR
ncbi:MAG: hypothetical protein ACT4OP_06330 [Actinomycetota bacterium]